VDDHDTPRDDERLNLHDESGMTRRDLIRRGAVVTGTLLWVAPAIQSISSKAYAQTNGSPLCEACIQTNFGGNIRHFTLVADTDCCDCLDANPEPLDAIINCLGQVCQPAGGSQPGPCP
jgi:hypothetical protein